MGCDLIGRSVTCSRPVERPLGREACNLHISFSDYFPVVQKQFGISTFIDTRILLWFEFGGREDTLGFHIFLSCFSILMGYLCALSSPTLRPLDSQEAKEREVNMMRLSSFTL